MRRFLSFNLALLLIAASVWALAGLGEWWVPHPTVIVTVVWVWDHGLYLAV